MPNSYDRQCHALSTKKVHLLCRKQKQVPFLSEEKIGAGQTDEHECEG